jgi:hypothetical protein
MLIYVFKYSTVKAKASESTEYIAYLWNIPTDADTVTLPNSCPE